MVATGGHRGDVLWLWLVLLIFVGVEMTHCFKFCLNGIQGHDSLSSTLSGKCLFLFPIGDGIDRNRGETYRWWRGLTARKQCHIHSQPCPPKVHIDWATHQLCVPWALNQSSSLFWGQVWCGWEEGFLGLSVPTELQSGLISHFLGASFSSDRLIAVWVVTKKESILLAVCLAKLNHLKKKLIKMSLSRGLQRVLQLWGRISVPQVKSCHVSPGWALEWWAGQAGELSPQLSQPGLPQGGALRGQLGTNGHLQTSSWCPNCLHLS